MIIQLKKRRSNIAVRDINGIESCNRGSTSEGGRVEGETDISHPKIFLQPKCCYNSNSSNDYIFLFGCKYLQNASESISKHRLFKHYLGGHATGPCTCKHQTWELASMPLQPRIGQGTCSKHRAFHKHHLTYIHTQITVLPIPF